MLHSVQLFLFHTLIAVPPTSRPKYMNEHFISYISEQIWLEKLLFPAAILTKRNTFLWIVYFTFLASLDLIKTNKQKQKKENHPQLNKSKKYSFSRGKCFCC